MNRELEFLENSVTALIIYVHSEMHTTLGSENLKVKTDLVLSVEIVLFILVSFSRINLLMSLGSNISLLL